MDVKELRIGNLLKMAGANYEVSSIHSDNTIRFKSGDSSIGCFKTNLTNPIPLTEEWLVRFGFEEITKKMFTKESFTYYYTRSGSTWHLEWFGESISHVRHVHQLQNLYFSLTGEELTIK